MTVRATAAPSWAAPGETLDTEGSGLIVRLAPGLALVNTVLALLVADRLTVHTSGTLVVSAAGTVNPTERVDAVVFVMALAVTGTGEPLPAGGVIVR